MSFTFLRASCALTLSSLVAIGCAAPTGESDGEESADSPETLGQTSQALNNCAEGISPNETFTLRNPGDTGRYIRTSYYINGTSCDGSPRPLTIVDYNVGGSTPVDRYHFRVKAMGATSNLALCNQFKLTTRIQKPNGSGGWENATSAGAVETRGVLRQGSDGFYCSMPEYTAIISGWNPTYRVRTFAEHPNGSYLGVDVNGLNMSF